MNKLTILVNSCDKCESVWDPFFKLFKIQWPDCPYKIYLNTETKEYKCDFLDVKTICTGNDISWSARVKKAIEQIDSEYILFMLEDFFLLDKVDTECFEEIFESFYQEKNAGFLFLHPQRSVNYRKRKPQNKYYSEIKRSHQYRVNACVGFWKKDFFMQMLYADTNAWRWEKEASLLTLISKYKCYGINPEYENVLNYSIYVDMGYGLTGGKWLDGNKKLFSNYGIDVNYDILGFKESSISGIKEKQKPKRKRNIAVRAINRLNKTIKRYKKYIEKEIYSHFKLRKGFKKYCKELKNK